MAVSNTVLYQEEWTVKYQDRLNHPTNWRGFCKVAFTNDRVLNNPYMSTVPSVQSHTRGSAYTNQAWALTIDTATINSSKILPMFIDRADLAQQTFVRQMEMADLQGTLMNEELESAMLASHASFTDFDNASIGGAAGNITVSATNIDDIIRGIKREVREANGQVEMAREGIAIIWRVADFEILEAFVQANGFSTADNALKDGTEVGFTYMGVEHRVSNDHTANHVLAGVKNTLSLGIVKSTWGQVVVNQDPVDSSNGQLSGINVVTRTDYIFKVWTNTKPILFDVLVA